MFRFSEACKIANDEIASSAFEIRYVLGKALDEIEQLRAALTICHGDLEDARRGWESAVERNNELTAELASLKNSAHSLASRQDQP